MGTSALTGIVANVSFFTPKAHRPGARLLESRALEATTAAEKNCGEGKGRSIGSGRSYGFPLHG